MKGKLSLWTLSVLFLTGCVETIVMDPHEDMPVVVYCVLTNKSDVQTLDLSAAESPSGEKPEVVAREVTVTASSGEKHVFATSDGARWTAQFRPEPLMKYSLRVLLADGEEISAETTFPDTLAINDNYYEGGHYRDKGYNRIFDESSGFTTRQFGFKLLEPTEKSRAFTYTVRDDTRYWSWGTDNLVTLTEEEKNNKKVALWEIHPYKKACFLWVTARSPQKPEEYPLNALYVPGHEYQSVYLATDNTYADNINTLQVTLGDLTCYSLDNVERIEKAIEERDRELIPSFYNVWKNEWIFGYGDYCWYGKNLKVKNDFTALSRYSDLPLHYKFIRIVYPEGGYMNQNTLSTPDRFDNQGNAIWIRDEAPVIPNASLISSQIPSPFTFQLFADFNLEDPYSWQRSAHRLSSGWVVFEFHNISEEYDTFLRTLYKSGYNDIFGDLTQNLYSREGVYSNISGGTGIFGAECVTVSLR